MNHPSDRAVITGMGAVTPIGVGTDQFTRSLRAGRSGVALIEPDDRLQTTVAARVTDVRHGDVLGSTEENRLPRLVPLALLAAREAIAQAKLDLAEEAGQIGLILGTGGGGIDFTLAQTRAIHRAKRPSLWTVTNATHGNLAGELSIQLGLRGPSLCVSTGCASSSDAVGHACDLLRSDRPGAPATVVVIGADAHVSPETLAGMELLRVISTRNWREEPQLAHTASRPFDRDRDGFVLGEGAWAIVLERRSHASSRGARPLGAVLGYGATCDAYHRVRPEPSMRESVRAMRLALADSELTPDQIELIHYHGTSTPVNDSQETAAVKAAFGEHATRLRGTSVKSMVGHPQGACGLAALVATLASATGADGQGPFVPPTAHLEHPDPECDLDYTPRVGVPTSASTALINCLAFGAKNSALVIKAFCQS